MERRVIKANGEICSEQSEIIRAHIPDFIDRDGKTTYKVSIIPDESPKITEEPVGMILDYLGKII